VGSALPADGVRPVARADCTHDSTGGQMQVGGEELDLRHDKRFEALLQERRSALFTAVCPSTPDSTLVTETFWRRCWRGMLSAAPETASRQTPPLDALLARQRSVVSPGTARRRRMCEATAYKTQRLVTMPLSSAEASAVGEGSIAISFAHRVSKHLDSTATTIA
jgi:hypothetical protein